MTRFLTTDTVAVMTSSPSAAGASLSINAFVLGIDHDITHDSTRLRRASNFRFIRCEALIHFSAQRLKAVRQHYQKEESDFLVNVVEDGANGRARGLDGSS
jgi:hypothetical protein